MYTIINILGKLSALISIIAIPLTANGLTATEGGVITMILGFIVCAICETAVKK